MKRKIKDLRLNESCYTVPWSIINQDNISYIHLNYSIFKDLHGTADMRITKIDHNLFLTPRGKIIGALPKDIRYIKNGVNINNYQMGGWK